MIRILCVTGGRINVVRCSTVLLNGRAIKAVLSFEFAVDDIKCAYSKSDTVRIRSQCYPFIN